MPNPVTHCEFDSRGRKSRASEFVTLLRHPPNRAADIIGHQQRAGFVHSQANRAAMVVISVYKAGQHILGHATGLAVRKGHEHHLVAIELPAIPTAMLAYKGTAAIVRGQPIGRVERQA